MLRVEFLGPFQGCERLGLIVRPARDHHTSGVRRRANHRRLPRRSTALVPEAAALRKRELLPEEGRIVTRQQAGDDLPRVTNGGDRILQIDQASPTAAFVKLQCAIPPRYFTDYLSLLKVEGRWQVAQKVFATERRE